jgi:hypothetical protein
VARKGKFTRKSKTLWLLFYLDGRPSRILGDAETAHQVADVTGAQLYKTNPVWKRVGIDRFRYATEEEGGGE